MVSDFDQAQALIKRVMEGVGGSADAYETPSAEVVSDLDLPTDGNVEDMEPKGEESCVGGLIDWIAWGKRLVTVSDHPITNEYQYKGSVEGFSELLAIHRGLLKSWTHDQPQMVKLDTGTYPTSKPTSIAGWQLLDTAKDRLYLQEDVSGSYDVVHPDDLFFWVLRPDDRQNDLGYIQLGYVFMRKKE